MTAVVKVPKNPINAKIPNTIATIVEGDQGEGGPGGGGIGSHFDQQIAM